MDDEDECEILGETDNFIAYFRQGKSVYENGASVYRPAKIIFGKLLPDGEIEILLEVSPRRS